MQTATDSTPVAADTEPTIGDQAFEKAQRLMEENAPKDKPLTARTLVVDPMTTIATIHDGDGSVAPASPHQIKIVLLQTATLELRRKGLRPGTRNFRRVFQKRTGYDFNQLQQEIRAESEQFIARLAQAAATRSDTLTAEASPELAAQVEEVKTS